MKIEDYVKLNTNFSVMAGVNLGIIFKGLPIYEDIKHITVNM